MLNSKMSMGIPQWVSFIVAGAVSIIPLLASSQILNAVITEESVVAVTPEIALVKWTTDVPTASQVVYGPVSHLTLSTADVPPLYGYTSMTPIQSIPTTDHAVAVTGVSNAQVYYVRPISILSGNPIVGSEMPVIINTTAGLESCQYLSSYLKKGAENNSDEVKLLQSFLITKELETSIAESGEFDEPTFEAVKRFQTKYKDDILSPWDIEEPTGFVYITTKQKINELHCGTKPDLTKEEQNIIGSSKSSPPPSETENIGSVDSASSGLLALDEPVATETSMLLADESKDDITSAGLGGLGASQGGIREFFSRNQFFIIILFILAFLGLYFYGNRSSTRNEVKKLPKTKPQSDTNEF